jgi:hypothetical protein
VNGARLSFYGPIPPPSSWVLASDAPPGFFQLVSLSITHRQSSKIPRSNLLPTESISTLPSDVERLLRAYALCDAAGRAEVLKIAEVLAGAAP